MARQTTGTGRSETSFGTSRGLVAAVVLAAFAAAELGVPTIALAEKSKTRVASVAVPMPRAKPGRSDADPIGSIIAEGSDAVAPLAPAVTAAPAPAASAPAPVQETASAADPTPPEISIPKVKSSFNAVGLRLAIKLLDDGDPGAATLAAYALPDPTDVKIVDWLVATSGDPRVPSSRIAEVMHKLADWPGQTLLRRRYELALYREKPNAQAVMKFLGGGAPASDEGTLLLTRAYIDAGRKADAAAVISPYWRDTRLTDDIDAQIRKEFGPLLTGADIKARMDKMLYDEQTGQASGAASLLNKDQRALAAAVILAIKGSSKAKAALDALPGSMKRDPLYTYTQIQLLRRAKKIEAAADLMLKAPRDAKALVDPDAWWIERRMISRALIESGDARKAYQIAAAHAAESSTLRAEAEFHAGWYALEYLRDPRRAIPHFAAIQSISTMPLSQSRAEYWLGRAAAAAGDKAMATEQFRRAGAYPTTFYGQLALARLGVRQLGLSAPPAPSAAVRQRFASREAVQVIQRMDAINRGDRAEIFYRHLAETLTDPSEIAMLAAMAEKGGEHQIALQVGKIAAQRGLPVETLAFPMAAIPKSAKTSVVERPMVYAIARQESAFNPGAISRAGARGLLQLMPATAKHVAKTLRMPYSQPRLTSDAAYNATLGAAHLGELYDKFAGSYVMTFAAYNAGSSRVAAWVAAYGDPRDPRVDVVNWIESIPFTETRNYVQRIMENLQVYRARLGSGPLTIEADLKHGAAR